MSDNTQDHGTDALDVLLADDEANNTTRAEMEREEAKKKIPPMVSLGKIPGVKAAMYYSIEKQETIDMKHIELNYANLRSSTSPQRWRAFFESGGGGESVQLTVKEISKATDKMIYITAIDFLLDSTRECKEPYNQLRLRDGGLYEETINGEKGLIWNAGSECYFLPHDGGENRRLRKVDHYQEAHIYNTMITSITPPAEKPLSFEDGRKLQDFFNTRQWEISCSGEIYLGCVAHGLMPGVAKMRPNCFVIAPSMTGKSELRKDTRLAVGDLAFHFVGTQTTEPAIRRKCDRHSRLVFYDEFVKDKTAAGKAEACRKMETMRGSHDHEDGIVNLCDENKGVRDYVLLNSYICYATAFPSDDPQDTSRFFVLRLSPWADCDKRLVMWKKQEDGRAMVERQGFNGELLTRIMWEYPHKLKNIEKLIPYLQKNRIEARRAVQLANVLSAQFSVTHGGLMDDAAMKHALDVAREYTNSETKTGEALAFLDTILDHVIEKGGANGHMNVRQLCQVIIKRLRKDESIRGFWAQTSLQAYGMSWSKIHDCLMIKSPLHEDLAKLVKDNPQWAGETPARIVSAGSKDSPNALGMWKNSSANINGNRCEALMVPRSLIASEDEEEGEK